MLILKIFTVLLILTYAFALGPLGSLNYSQALGYSILFYEAQRSGPLPKTNRIPWRKDSALNEGKGLVGGWYTAGNNMKFHFPLASSTTLLSWGILELSQGYKFAGELENALDQIEWIVRYFLKTTQDIEQNILYSQVQTSKVDYIYWGRPEDMEMFDDLNARPVYQNDETVPGSDLAAELAAALSAAYLVFKQHGIATDIHEELVRKAKECYRFAEEFRGFSHNTPEAPYNETLYSQDAKEWYESSSFMDELTWGAAWLYKATGESKYLNKAERYYSQANCQWHMEQSWSGKCPGSSVLLSQLYRYGTTKQVEYKDKAIGQLAHWLGESDIISYTEKGLAFYLEWGSLAYPGNIGLVMGIFREQLKDWDLHKDLQARYAVFIHSQVHYLLGDATGFSFMIGFGDVYADRPHHPGSTCPADHSIPCMYFCPGANCEIAKSEGPNAQVLYGAIVGGPDKNDVFSNDRDDYLQNEISTTYNAGFQGTIAYMVLMQNVEGNLPDQPDSGNPIFTPPPTTPSPGETSDGFVLAAPLILLGVCFFASLTLLV